jgi:predicted  nucleic acid-binding Zn-ribbon protein
MDIGNLNCGIRRFGSHSRECRQERELDKPMNCPKCGVDVFAHGETCPTTNQDRLREALLNLLDLYDKASSMEDFSESWITAIENAKAALAAVPEVAGGERQSSTCVVVGMGF